jgi:hypothetical protein
MFLLAFHQLYPESMLEIISGSPHVLVVFLPLCRQSKLDPVSNVNRLNVISFLHMLMFHCRILLKDFNGISFLESVLQDV